MPTRARLSVAPDGRATRCMLPPSRPPEHPLMHGCDMWMGVQILLHPPGVMSERVLAKTKMLRVPCVRCAIARLETEYSHSRC
mmetsp:Transcript_12049/g.35476  ORF Transcript_12049/g.35476 Transcript_12049/m.35476 type:complete len:83 (+) Transcript_12049:1753-2001(+)|eukprot:4495411-Prymnesium_polylepis.1